MVDSNFNIRETLLKALNEKGISQRELCRRINITPNGLQGILKTNDIRVSKLFDICNEIDIDIISFFDSEYIEDSNQMSLKKENELLRELVASKDKTISQLELRILERKGE